MRHVGMRVSLGKLSVGEDSHALNKSLVMILMFCECWKGKTWLVHGLSKGEKMVMEGREVRWLVWDSGEAMLMGE